MPEYHVAQLNIGRMLAPLDTPQMSGFVNNLDRINALAEETEGFVWRLQTEEGDATALRPFDDDWLIVNMSVWENIDALYQYTYYTAHAEIFKDRKQWFEKMDSAYMVLWYVPAGSIPTLDEAKERLEHLRTHGATPHAFTFKQRFSIEELAATQTNE